MNNVIEKRMFAETPICEICKIKEANSLSCFFGQDDYDWKFCCDCADQEEDYYIQFEKFFRSPSSTLAWIGHLNEKTWFNQKKFVDMLSRLRDETRSFNT